MAKTVPSSWTATTLGQVVRLQRGHDLPSSARVPGVVPVVGSGGSDGWHNEAAASGPGVVIGRATNLGRPKFIREDYWPLNTTLYVKDFLSNEPRYVFYLFGSLDLTGYDSGSVQPMLNRNYVQGVPVQLPPLPEQRAIAEVLGALDDKIEANRSVVGLADALGRALYESVDKCEVRVADVAKVLMGQSPPGSTYNGHEEQDGLPFYQGTRDFGFRHPSLRIWCSAASRVAEARDVLVSVRAPVGSLNVAWQRCAIGRGVASLRSPSTPSVLFHAVAANRSYWFPFEGEGTVFGSIGREQLSRLRPQEGGLEGQ